MTIKSPATRNEYTATAGQTVFTYTFKIFASTDLNVYQTAAGQVCSDSDLITSYSVSGVGDEDGGSITLNSGATSGDLITIVSDIPGTRTTDYQNNGDFLPDTVNDDFDRVVSLVKQVEDKANRSLQFPECLQGVTELSLPSPSAGSFLKWKSDLSGLENTFNATNSTTATTTHRYFMEFTDGVSGAGISGSDVESVLGVTLLDGDLIITEHYDSDRNIDTGAAFQYTNVTTAGKAGNAPDTNGKFHDSTGKEFNKVGRKNVLTFGAVGDGTTDDTTAIKAAIAAASGATVYFPKGRYLISDVLTITGDNITIAGDGPKESVLLKAAAGGFHMLDVGDLTLRDTSQSNTLASNASAGGTTLTLSTGKGSNFTADSWVVLLSTATITGGSTRTKAEFVHIFSISTDTLTLSAPIRDDYATADTAEVQNVDMVEGFALKGIGFDGNDHATAGGGVNDENAIVLTWCKEPEISNVSGKKFINYFLGLRGCLRARGHQIEAIDLPSNGFQGNSGSFGYAVTELGLNEGGTFDQITTDRVRHAYTNATGGLTIGTAVGTVVNGGVARNCRGAGFDTHPSALDVTFDSCTVVGSLFHGFQSRGQNDKFVGCVARDCIGAAMRISSDADNAVIDDLTFNNTNLGTDDATSTDWTAEDAIVDDGVATQIDGMISQRADQTVNNSTTLVDSDDLKYRLSQRERVTFALAVRYNTNDTADIKVAVTGPAGSAIRLVGVQGARWSSADTWTQMTENGGGSSINISGAGKWQHFWGYVENGSTRGDLQVQFAQNTADASDTKLQEGSTLQIFNNGRKAT